MELKEAEIIHKLHMQEGWRWGDYGVPEESDVEEVLRRLLGILEGKDDGATVEATRILVAKHNGETSVYIKVGTVGEADG